ncbi:S-adenosyl-L-methionine-dependent methyltransferase [Coemansia reversa NRRL 1564]|uniref:Arsenite methyltransferase n=1 Tax=Coemansia reversa (strain ATCC 12441 / NRRL 1564) TaxID=763665 RepID=A0A2G5BCR1_COERN|nr:S-adenosyl-L-methionine-dependent methyltransferase [Coemansia reversa NRRL 1564]|eukprot:PIA16791.1 S-adenosyl-L-methionine-dependent methyltransferase [Coemansia reversa NRRL 1564]
MLPLENSEDIHSSVKTYYGKVLTSSKDLKTSACTAAAAPHSIVRKAIESVPKAVNDKFYGCGNPIPLGIKGKDILDLGSGSGRDCYVASALVGPEGSVTGIDMTDEQLQIARDSIGEFEQTLGYTPKLKFVTGYIEELQKAGIEPSTIDVCISNCVINLSPNKKLVLEGVHQALRKGGELYFSDMYADARLPESVRKNDVLIGEGIGGALYVKDFEQMAKEIGFAHPRVLSISPIAIKDKELQALVANTRYYSITYRLFKTDEHKATKRTGFTARYLGTIEGHEDKYELDIDNVFDKDVSTLVSRSTAAILSSSWLSGFFAVEETPNSASGLAALPSTAKTLINHLRRLEQQSSNASGGCCSTGGAQGGCC